MINKIVRNIWFIVIVFIETSGNCTEIDTIQNKWYKATADKDTFQFAWVKSEVGNQNAQELSWELALRQNNVTVRIPYLPYDQAITMPHIDTVFFADVNFDSSKETIIIYSDVCYLREFSSQGKIFFLACITKSDAGYRVLPFFSEYLSGARVGVDLNGSNCNDKFCSVNAITSEIFRLMKLQKKEFLEFVLSFANKLYNDKMRKDAATVSFVIMDYMNLLTKDNVGIFNDYAFFLEQGKKYNDAIVVLKEVVNKFPTRTVAYINLGDAYFELNNTAKAKDAYTTYIDLMKKEGKEKKIPQRVFERINE